MYGQKKKSPLRRLMLERSLRRHPFPLSSFRHTEQAVHLAKQAPLPSMVGGLILVESGSTRAGTSSKVLALLALDKNHFLVFGARTATPPSCPSGRTVLEHWLQEVTRIPVAGLWRLWCLLGHAKYSVHVLSPHNTKPDDPLMVCSSRNGRV